MAQLKDIKLGIGIPLVNRLIDRAFFLSFVVMEKPDHYTLLTPTNEIYGFPKDIAHARDGIVHQAIDAECTHLIMMDTDQIYPANTIVKLLKNFESKNIYVCGTVIHRRYPPFNPLLLRGELGKHTRVPDEEVYSGELIEITATGCGCICYDMRVFGLLQPPWFELIRNDDGKPVGEDIRFCHKLIGAGVKIYADTSIEIDHLTTFKVDRQTHELFKLINGPDTRS